MLPYARGRRISRDSFVYRVDIALPSAGDDRPGERPWEVAVLTDWVGSRDLSEDPCHAASTTSVWRRKAAAGRHVMDGRLVQPQGSSRGGEVSGHYPFSVLGTVYTCIQQIFEADPDDEGVWAVITCTTVAGHGREGGRRRERGSAPGEGYRIGGFSR